ncbi:MAG: biotin/lipoyl-containing protein, partial [Leptolinea sp.]
MAETITMPKLGFDMAEGLLVRWVKAEGETVNKGDVLAEIETDKATVEVESSFSGVMYRHMVEQSSMVPVGTPIAIIAAPGERVAEQATPTGKENPKMQELLPVADQESESKAASETINIPGAAAEMVKASPLAKRIAREFGITLDGISGSGPGGRIVRKDIELAATEINTAREAITAVAAEIKGGVTPLLLPEAWTGIAAERESKHIPLSKLR